MRRHLESWMLSLQARRKRRGDTGRRPKQEQSETTTRAHTRQEGDEVDAGDGRADPAALALCGPDHAGAVGKTQLSRFQDPREVAVSARPHHKLGIDRGDQVMPTGVDELLDATKGGLHVDAVDPHPKNANLGAYLRSSSAGLVIGGSVMPTVSKSRAVTTVCGIGAPRLPAKSDRLSPPPTRTRVHV